MGTTANKKKIKKKQKLHRMTDFSFSYEDTDDDDFFDQIGLIIDRDDDIHSTHSESDNSEEHNITNMFASNSKNSNQKM